MKVFEVYKASDAWCIADQYWDTLSLSNDFSGFISERPVLSVETREFQR